MMRRVLVGIAFVAVCTGAAWLVSLREARPVEGRIVIEPAVVSLDPALHGAEDLSVRLAVANRTSREQTLRLKASCGCSKLTPDSLTLAPGASQSIQVDIEPPDRLAPYTVRIYAVDEASGETIVESQIRGSVVPWLTAPVQTVQLATFGEGGSDTRSIEIANPSDRVFSGRVVSSGATAEFLTVEPQDFRVEPGATRVLTVTAAHPGYRRVRGQIEILEAAGDKSAHQLDVVLTGESHYVANPPALMWSSETAVEQPLTVGLDRRDGRPFRIVTARLEPQVPWLSVAYGEEMQATHRFQVAVSDEGRGRSYTGALVVQTDCPDEPKAVPVRLVASSGSSGVGN